MFNLTRLYTLMRSTEFSLDLIRISCLVSYIVLYPGSGFCGIKRGGGSVLLKLLENSDCFDSAGLFWRRVALALKFDAGARLCWKS
jgi:hypothetical protein